MNKLTLEYNPKEFLNKGRYNYFYVSGPNNPGGATVRSDTFGHGVSMCNLFQDNSQEPWCKSFEKAPTGSVLPIVTIKTIKPQTQLTIIGFHLILQQKPENVEVNLGPFCSLSIQDGENVREIMTNTDTEIQKFNFIRQPKLAKSAMSGKLDSPAAGEGSSDKPSVAHFKASDNPSSAPLHASAAGEGSTDKPSAAHFKASDNPSSAPLHASAAGEGASNKPFVFGDSSPDVKFKAPDVGTGSTNPFAATGQMPVMRKP